jgi:hypothetical protein
MCATRRLKPLFFVAVPVLAVAALATAIVRSYVGAAERRNVLTAEGQPELVVMDFSEPIPLDPPPDGWRHREFWTRRPMDMSFGLKEGRPAIRLATDDSASMLFRHLDVDLAEYPTLAWQWYVEKAIESPLDERTSEGDDHPARLFIAFRTGAGERRAMEIIWGNRLRAGAYKYIGEFPHYVANGGEENLGRWRDERVDLLGIYRDIWGDEPSPRITDIALFCDSDETDTSSIAYFGLVTLERRPPV